jgi:hypothetical protein
MIHLRRALSLVAAALLTSLALAVSAQVATAEEGLIPSPGGSITAASLGKVTFLAGESRVVCNLTLRGQLNGETGTEKAPEAVVIPVVSGAHVGEVSEVSWRECEGGEIARVSGVPWALKFSRLLGTSPEGLSGFQYNLEGATIQFSILGGFIRCTYRGALATLAALTHESGPFYTSGLLRSLENEVALESGAGCPATGKLRGTFALTPAQEVLVQQAKPFYRVLPKGVQAVKRLEFGRIRPEQRFAIEVEVKWIENQTALGGCTVINETDFKLGMPNGCRATVERNTPTARVKITFDPRGTIGEFIEQFQLPPITGVGSEIELRGRTN